MPQIALWRRPAKSGAHTPLVVLLHGRGADERDLIGLADDLPRHAAYASVRAPVPVDGGGYTWFENRGVARPIPASLRASVRDLRAWLDGEAGAPPRERCFLFGFSAGMMMAGALLFDDPTRFGGAVLSSGALALDADSNAKPGRLAGVPLFYATGSLDDVIPTELATATGSYLRERSGAELVERTYRRGHGIAAHEVADIAAWLGERL